MSARTSSWLRAGRGLLALAAAALLAGLAPAAARAQADERCFAETGFCVSGRIRAYWEGNGGLAVFGFPIGPQQAEQVEGRAIQAQWFERTRLELHPENQPPYDVLLGRIGADVLQQRGRDWFAFPRGEPRAGCRFFPETGHSVCGAILRAWQASGLQLDGRRAVSYEESLALFGLPLGEEQTETVEGSSLTVQWFERARFELHPGNQPPYDVLLGRLGAEARAEIQRYVLPGSAVFPEGVAYQPSTGDFFVSSTGDGTVFRGNTARGAAQPFLPGGADERSAATGMKVDDARGRLFVSGGATGRMFVYEAQSGRLLAALRTSRTPTFINDVALLPNGDALFTDSQSPVLYRVAAQPDGSFALQEWLDFGGTALQYQPGFNLNGIDATPDGAYLVAVQSNTGKLFRIDTATRAVAEISLGGASLPNGDGLLLDGETLYVVQNQQGVIAKLQLAEDLGAATLAGTTALPAFQYPTTIARAGDRLLVVNSQFDKRGPGLQPALPFTVVSIPLP